MSGVELHAHTTASDGTFTPSETVDRARLLGLEALAITDHDTMAGVVEAQLQAAGSIEIVPGIEISCLLQEVPLHLLAYWPDLTYPELGDELGKIRFSRIQRAMEMVRRLQEMGHQVTFDRVMHFARGGNPGRPHMAQALVEAGVVRATHDAFTEQLIGTGGRAYVEKYSLEPERAVLLVRRAGGVAVLAHPGSGARPVAVEIIASLAEAGLAGIEAGHARHTPEEVQRYREVADELDLVPTAGSDCHGDLYDPVRLGTCRVSREVLEALRARRG
ncbi:MAG: PHP domain-containing protein [Actinomycetota bacterium]